MSTPTGTSELESVTNEAVGQLKIRLNEAIFALCKQNRKTGFGLQEVENMMNLSYNEIHAKLQDYISTRFAGALCAEALHYFETESAKLKNDMTVLYNQHKMAALNAALNSASFNLDYCIKNNVTYLPSQLAQHATSVQQHLMQTVNGWFDGQPGDSVREEFLTELQSVLTNDIEVYKKHLVSSSSKKAGGKKSVVMSEDQSLSAAINSLKSSMNNLLHNFSSQYPEGYSVDHVNDAFNSKFLELEQTLPTDAAKSQFKTSCEEYYTQVLKNYQTQQESQVLQLQSRLAKPSRQSSGSSGSVCSNHSHKSSRSHNSRSSKSATLSENISAATSAVAAAAAAAASTMPSTPSAVKKRKELANKKAAAVAARASTGTAARSEKPSAWEEQQQQQREDDEEEDEVDHFYAATPLNMGGMAGGRRKTIGAYSSAATSSATPMKVAATPSKSSGSSSVGTGGGMRSSGSREDLVAMSPALNAAVVGNSSNSSRNKLIAAVNSSAIVINGGDRSTTAGSGTSGAVATLGSGGNAISESVQAKRRKSEGASDNDIASYKELDSASTVVISKSLGMSLAAAKAAAREAEEERIKNAILKKMQQKKSK